MTICEEPYRRIREDEHCKNAGYERSTWEKVPEHCKRQIAKHSGDMQRADPAYLGQVMGENGADKLDHISGGVKAS